MNIFTRCFKHYFRTYFGINVSSKILTLCVIQI